jgi:hypothetical protein
MVITSGSFAKALYPGVNEWYGKSYNEHKVEYADLFDTFTSRRAFEEDMSISSFGMAQVRSEGNGVAYDNEQQGFLTRYQHVEYALGFIITRNMMEDDLYDVVGERKARGLAFSMRQTKETVGANVYNRAFNSTYTGGDGKELLATDHPNVSGGTFSNELTTAADLSEAALEQAVTDLMKFTNDSGLKIAIRPQTLIIPVDLWHVADKIMKTEYEVDTANNTVNVVRSKFPGGVKVNHYLTDTDAWFIRTSGATSGMKHWVRRADDFSTDDDFDTDNAKFKATARYSFGWSDPRALFGSPGA